MTYWQEVRSEWMMSLAIGGILSFIMTWGLTLIVMFDVVKWMAPYLFSGLTLWLPLFFTIDMAIVAAKREIL